MSGTYPDAPNARIPYHVNGSAVVHLWYAAEIVTEDGTRRAALNDEDGTTEGTALVGATADSWFAVIFPEPYDLTHYFAHLAGGTFIPLGITTSTDTTNGVDGSWTAITPDPWTAEASTPILYRTSIQALGGAVTGVRGIKFHGDTATYGYTGRMNTLHLYGTPAAGASPNRLELWHPTLDQPLSDTPAHLDWAEVALGTIPAPRQFRIKNLSLSLTASSVVVGFDTLTDPSSHYKNAHTFSDDGITYASTATVASIAPEDISDVLYVKYAPSLSDDLTLRTGFVKTTTGGWA